MNTGFRATTAARRTSPAQGAIIAAETASPAWLLAQRSAQWSQSGAEDGTEGRLADSGDKVG